MMQFHENAAVIAWWCARFGRLLAWFTPVRRRLFLALLTLLVLVRKPLSLMGEQAALPLPKDAVGLAAVVLVLLALVWLCYQAAVKFAALPAVVRRNPQWTLHLFFWAMLALLWNTLPTAGLWREVLLGVAVVFPFLLWRLGYLLQSGQHGRAGKSRFRDHLLTIWPIYGGSNTPYGKGIDFLSRSEAQTVEQLARSQLAGIKLLVLAIAWTVLRELMQRGFYGSESLLAVQTGGGIPLLRELIDQGSHAPRLASWASIYCELVYQVLSHAIRGLKIVAALRFCGFNVFRNTYKPLLAESIVEFWNRYYYYFKELMANFFFTPTFMQLGRSLQKWPNLRLFVAVFAAAFVGNMYYHVIKDIDLIVLGDVYGAVYGLRSRFFYCLLLALGIFVSMWRSQNRAGRAPIAGLHGRCLRIFGVWTFFSLIYIWNVGGGEGFLLRTEFFLGLFGLQVDI